MESPLSATDEVAGLCSDLIRFDTSNFGPSGAKGEREAAEYVAAKLDDVGITSQLFESEPRRTTLVADWAPEGCDTSLPPLLIHGHTDVVPAVASDWQVDPFAGEIVDGYVWGRGAVDMKDFDAILLSVVRERVREGRAPRRPIRLVFTADEEAGGPLGATWLARTHPEFIADCTEAIGEVGGFSLSVNDQRLYLIQTAEKGLAWLNLIAKGSAGHGSMRNDDNAITSLAEAVSRIGNHTWPARIRPAQQQFLDAIEKVLGIEIRTDDAEQTLARLGSIARMVGATMSNTANPTMLEGGYKLNVIPGHAIRRHRRTLHPRLRAGVLRHHHRADRRPGALRGRDLRTGRRDHLRRRPGGRHDRQPDSGGSRRHRRAVHDECRHRREGLVAAGRPVLRLRPAAAACRARLRRPLPRRGRAGAGRIAPVRLSRPRPLPRPGLT